MSSWLAPRPEDPFDVPFLATADHLASGVHPQPGRDVGRAGEDLYLRRSGPAFHALLPHAERVGPRLLAAGADVAFRVRRQVRDVRLDPPGHEGALAGPGFHQPLPLQAPEGVPDGVPRCGVPIPQFELGRQLAAPRQFAGLDLSAQVLRDLLVHRLGHHILLPTLVTGHLIPDVGITGMGCSVGLGPSGRAGLGASRSPPDFREKCLVSGA
jgi:hypothetical protein